MIILGIFNLVGLKLVNPRSQTFWFCFLKECEIGLIPHTHLQFVPNFNFSKWQFWRRYQFHIWPCFALLEFFWSWAKQEDSAVTVTSRLVCYYVIYCCMIWGKIHQIVVKIVQFWKTFPIFLNWIVILPGWSVIVFLKLVKSIIFSYCIKSPIPPSRVGKECPKAIILIPLVFAPTMTIKVGGQ